MHVEIPEPTAKQHERRELGPVTGSMTWATATPSEILADLQTIADAQTPPWHAPPFGETPLHEMAVATLFGPGLGSLAETFDAVHKAIATAYAIPLDMLLGRSPAGLGATGESDARRFYERVRLEQARFFACVARSRPRTRRQIIRAAARARKLRRGWA